MAFIPQKNFYDVYRRGIVGVCAHYAPAVILHVDKLF